MDVTAIRNFPGYFVDTLGNVYTKWKRNRWYGSIATGDLQRLKPNNVRGYLQVTLRKDGKAYYRKIHFLVLETFIGERPSDYEACHNDGNKHNNNLSNLRWDTRSSNYTDRIKHGSDNTGKKNGRAKLTEEKVLEIRQRINNGETQDKLGAEFNVTQVMISRIKLRKAWIHI